MTIIPAPAALLDDTSPPADEKYVEGLRAELARGVERRRLKAAELFIDK